VFAAMVDPNMVKEQFELFKTFMHTHHNDLVIEWNRPDGAGKRTPKKPMRFQEFMKRFPDDLATFDELFTIMQIALLTPMTSVPCERVFSKVTVIKTKWRNHLLTKVLDALMRISMVDITVAFCVAFPNLALKAIDYFVDLRSRYTGAKTKVDARKKQVLKEREEKADALKELCHGLDEICIGDGISSDEDDERETFIVDYED
jgi:hypothetical protein